MKPRFEVAHILERFWEKCDKTRFTAHQKKTLDALKRCRTAALGGHIDACDSCGSIKISYNSCRNRHCPKCQSVEKEMWMIQREEELLPVGYFHVVFTLPHELNPACIHYPDSLYNLLFEAAKYTLLTFANDPKWLGALPGISMILHTWGQNLSLHPHVHCIVSGGGITPEGKWLQPQNASGKFLFPVKAMSKVFRAYFLKQLNLRFQQGQIPLLAPDFELLKAKIAAKEWVIYAKKPFGGVKNVVEYLGRYTHKIAISNHRILAIDENSIAFSYKDYADKGKKKAMTLVPQEFIRRFTQHILPPGFRRIRHFGFLSNSLKNKLLPAARAALNQPQKTKSTRKERKEAAIQRLFPEAKNHKCPHCQTGTFQTVQTLPPQRAPPTTPVSRSQTL